MDDDARNNMVERVAWAIAIAQGEQEDPLSDHVKERFEAYWPAARAAIAARRDPTPRMLSVGKMYDTLTNYQAMIDEALAEPS